MRAPRAPGRGRRIVVGYDASAGAERALSFAAARVGASGRLLVVHAARAQDGALPGPHRPGGGDARMARAAAVAELPFLERSDVFDPERCEFEVTDEPPAAALLRAAERFEADEIVVGTRRSGRVRWRDGSVCSELIDQSQRPVVVVP